MPVYNYAVMLIHCKDNNVIMTICFLRVIQNTHTKHTYIHVDALFVNE